MAHKLSGFYTGTGDHVEIYHRYEPVGGEEAHWSFEQYLDVHVNGDIEATHYVNSFHGKEDISRVLQHKRRRWIGRNVPLEQIIAEIEDIESAIE